MSDPWQAFSDRVTCEDRWSVDALTLEWPLPEGQATQLAERNAVALATLGALEDRRPETTDEDTPVLQELARLDAKLTALVDIVNRLLVPAESRPPRRRVQFNALGAVIPMQLVPSGAAILLRLRFDVCPSLPLELPARLERQLDDGRAFVVFLEMSEATGDAIERHVFRHHRRKVAESRQL